MTKKELCEKLAQVPDDAQVALFNTSTSEDVEIDEVRLHTADWHDAAAHPEETQYVEIIFHYTPWEDD